MADDVMLQLMVVVEQRLTVVPEIPVSQATAHHDYALRPGYQAL